MSGTDFKNIWGKMFAPIDLKFKHNIVEKLCVHLRQKQKKTKTNSKSCPFIAKNFFARCEEKKIVCLQYSSECAN